MLGIERVCLCGERAAVDGDRDEVELVAVQRERRIPVARRGVPLQREPGANLGVLLVQRELEIDRPDQERRGPIVLEVDRRRNRVSYHGARGGQVTDSPSLQDRRARFRYASPAFEPQEPAMKAYWIRPQGDRPVIELRETPSPEPKAGQVLVRVHAAALNRGELIVRHGIHATPGKPAAEAKPGGAECAGEVERVGAGVTTAKPGDRVMGRAPAGLPSTP